MKKKILKIIMGVLLIAAALVLTLKFIKMLPAFVKILALAADVATVYYAVNFLILNKNKNKKNDS